MGGSVALIGRKTLEDKGYVSYRISMSGKKDRSSISIFYTDDMLFLILQAFSVLLILTHFLVLILIFSHCIYCLLSVPIITPTQNMDVS